MFPEQKTPQIVVKNLIASSMLLSEETRMRWLAKAETLTDEQCVEVEKALTDSNVELKTIISTAMAAPENAKLAEKIQNDIDRAWRTYMKDAESLSREGENMVTDDLLSQL